MLLRRLESGTELWHVVDEAAFARFRDSTIALYQRVFAEPPYEERFSQEEASSILDRLVRTPHQITVIATRGDTVLGFGIAIPLPAAKATARELNGILPVKHTMYLAELGIEPGWRPRLARVLTKARLTLIDREAYTHVALRVAEGRNSTREMYGSLGFKDTGVTMQVAHVRTDGTLRSDERELWARVLSQVKLDASD